MKHLMHARFYKFFGDLAKYHNYEFYYINTINTSAIKIQNIFSLELAA